MSAGLSLFISVSSNYKYISYPLSSFESNIHG